MAMINSVFKVGDRVRHVTTKETGVVIEVPVLRELRDVVIVRFRGIGDGYSVMTRVLEKIGD